MRTIGLAVGADIIRPRTPLCTKGGRPMAAPTMWHAAGTHGISLRIRPDEGIGPYGVQKIPGFRVGADALIGPG